MAARGPPPGRPSIDRTKTTPFMIRVFVSASSGGQHHPDSAFSTSSGMSRLERDEYDIYTWRDCTMRDVVVSVLSSEAGAKIVPLGTARYSLRHVFYDDRQDRYTSRDVGLVFARELGKSAGELRGPPSRTLEDIRFVVGDYLDLAFLPSGNIGTAGAPTGPAGRFANGGGGGDRYRNAGDGPRRRSRSPSPRRGAVPW